MSHQQIENTPEELEMGEITADQERFLSELNHQEAAAEADDEATEAEAEAEAEANAEAESVAQLTAWGGLGMIEFGLKQVVHPDFAFTQETKAYAVDNMAPLLIKYGALLPDWIAQYQEEIGAAKAAARLVSEGMKTTKALKAKDVTEPTQDAQEPQNV